MNTVLSLTACFADHMVLQRDVPLRVRGRAVPGDRVRVRLAGREAGTRADDAGAWRVTLDPLPAGGPHELTIETDRSGRRTLLDVMLGEVWLCAGQSNMEWPVSLGGFSPALLEQAGRDDIRLFKVPVGMSLRERADVNASWVRCDATTVQDFSAIGYAFGRLLQRRLGVAVGLIQAALGGSTGEAWASWEALQHDPELRPILDRWQAAEPHQDPDAPALREAFEDFVKNPIHEDPGIRPEAHGWPAPDFDDSGWATMNLPVYVQAELREEFNGAFWFRRAIDIPADWAGRDLLLELGPIDDYDITFFNGHRVGATGPAAVSPYATPRRYRMAAELVRPGSNVIAVRVFDRGNWGGIWGRPDQMALSAAGVSGARLPLAGPWRWRIETKLKSRRNPLTEMWSRPAGLFNAMLAPLTGFPIRGALWYQGESNVDRAEQYRHLLPALIRDWRRRWEQDFAFLIVQLPNYKAIQPRPAPSDWAELRESQALALREPHTALAVTLDAGDADDIHPANKRLVAHRLALLARARVYGEPHLEDSGPVFKGMTLDGDTVRLRFTHADGLVARGGPPLVGFALAADDRVFRPAEARIENDTVLVRHPEIPRPVAVRYAWADNPQANLINAVSLPAAPFRTDDWPGITTGKR